MAAVDQAPSQDAASAALIIRWNEDNGDYIITSSASSCEVSFAKLGYHMLSASNLMTEAVNCS